MVSTKLSLMDGKKQVNNDLTFCAYHSHWALLSQYMLVSYCLLQAIYSGFLQYQPQN